MKSQPGTILRDPALLLAAAREAVLKLDPRIQARNPVMLLVWAGAALVTLAAIANSGGSALESRGFAIVVAALLWFTVWSANLAEALAEGRGRAQAASLRAARQSTQARRLETPDRNATAEMVAPTRLAPGDCVLVLAGETIPVDGEVVDGIAAVDESAVTGESAPVIRERGGERAAVTGGTRVLSDWLVIRVTAAVGQSFLDRMIGLVEGAHRRRTPNEIALSTLLAGLSLVLLLACTTLGPFAAAAARLSGSGDGIPVVVLVALLVCLLPTTIGGLLSAIGIAGMDRMLRANVVATSGRAVEAAGDVDVLVLDKTGTITLGNRQAVAFHAAPGVDEVLLADAAQLASLADETPEGRSVVVLAKHRFELRGRPIEELSATFVPFAAETRMSGVDLPDRRIRKGAVDAVARWLAEAGATMPAAVKEVADAVARRGATPLVVVVDTTALGVIELADVVKGGIRDRFRELRQMGIETIMVTGDNPLTAAAIAAEAGVDDFLAEATPEAKLAMIRALQAKGRLVAMTGDGTNDAPALAQADVAVAMHSGTQAAKEAANMVDLDSNPTKLLETVAIGKQLLMTRGALATFSFANDVAKYFAILPAALAPMYPGLATFDVMRLGSATSAVLAALIFNAVVIVALVPLALKGVRAQGLSAGALLRRHLLIYGAGGLVVPFVGIKLIDMVLALGGLR